MTRFSMRLSLTLALMATALCTHAHAQSGPGCVPAPGSDDAFQQDIARAWLPMRIGIDVARAACRAHEFVADLLKRKPEPDGLTLDDVVESSKPDVGTRHDASYDAQRAKMPSPTTRPSWNQHPTTSIVVLPPNTAGGVPVLFQPNSADRVQTPAPTSVSNIQGPGTLLSAEGMKRGTFQNGKLNGVGEEIDPDGTWRAGTYDRGTNVGQVFEVKRVGGRTYLTHGAIVDGKRDGMVERVFADGSTQFEDWEDGKLMQVGNRAPKGQAALAPQTRYKPPAQVAVEDAYKHTGPRTSIAPGTTFDPARSAMKTTPRRLSFEEAFADYKKSCEGIRAAKMRNSWTDIEKLDNSAGIADNWNIELFKSEDISGWVNSVSRESRGVIGPASYDDLAYLNYGLAICAVNVRLRQLGKPVLPFVG